DPAPGDGVNDRQRPGRWGRDDRSVARTRAASDRRGAGSAVPARGQAEDRRARTGGAASMPREEEVRPGVDLGDPGGGGLGARSVQAEGQQIEEPAASIGADQWTAGPVRL